MMLCVEIGFDKGMLELMLTAGEPPGKEKTCVLKRVSMHGAIQIPTG